MNDKHKKGCKLTEKMDYVLRPPDKCWRRREGEEEDKKEKEEEGRRKGRMTTKIKIVVFTLFSESQCFIQTLI